MNNSIIKSNPIMNSPDNYENYDFITSLYNQPSFQKFNSYKEKTHSTQRDSDFYCNYYPMASPVVPSQFDIRSSTESTPSSPESVAQMFYSPIQISLSASMVQGNSGMTFNDIALEKVNQRIPNVSQLPDSLLPEFHQYSKEIYMNSGSSKRGRYQKRQQEKYDASVDSSELRRQVHIQSEQKRRAEIKDGFETLRQNVPGCVNKKLSKATLLKRTVQHLQHLKKNQASILAELKKLVQENEMLKLKQ